MNMMGVLRTAAMAAGLAITPLAVADVGSDSARIGLPGFFEGPGNSVAARDSDPFGGSDVNCTGDYFASMAQANDGVGRKPGFHDQAVPDILSILMTFGTLADGFLPGCEVLFPR